MYIYKSFTLYSIYLLRVRAKLHKTRLAGRRIGEIPFQRGTEPLSRFRFATCTEG